MDSTTIISLVVIFIGVSILVIYQRMKKKQEEKSIISTLQSFASEYDGKITSYDHWDKTLIGMENSGVNKLFFIRKVNNNEFRKMINLSDIKDCQVLKSERTVAVGNEKYHVIDRIQLAMKYADKNMQPIQLEFYNSDYDQLTLSGELQLAEKWLSLVKSCMSMKKQS